MPHWGIDNDGMRAFYWLTDSGIASGDDATGLPQKWSDTEPFICIVGLPQATVEKPAQPLPETFWQALESRKVPMGIWCHYGGNLDLAKVGMRWNVWEHLTPACRKRFERILGGYRHPLPFSAGQDNLPWHLGFTKIKQVVKNRPTNSAGVRPNVHETLSTIWKDAHEFLNLELQLLRMNEISPVAFTLNEIKRRLEVCTAESFEKARYAAQLFEQMGVSVLAPRSSLEPDEWTAKMLELCDYVSMDGRALVEMVNGTTETFTSSEDRKQCAADTLQSFMQLIGEFEKDWKEHFTLMHTRFKADPTIPQKTRFPNGGT